jgi:hypothetical protein
LSGETTFIKLSGFCVYGAFVGNRAVIGFDYCIDDNGANTGDNGRNTFANNSLAVGTATLGFTPRSDSAEIGSIHTGGTALAIKNSYLQSKVFFSPLLTIPSLTAGSYTFDWRSYGGMTWWVQVVATQAASITDITGEYGDGHQLTIMSGASGGGGSLTLVYDPAKIQLQGNVNAVMTLDQAVTFVSRSGIWIEISRNF